MTGVADCVTDAVPDAELEAEAEAEAEREAEWEAKAETEAVAEADDIALADELATNVRRKLALKLAAVGDADCAMLTLGVGRALVEGGVPGSGGAELGANARKLVVLRARQGSLSKAKLESAPSVMAST